MLSRFPIHLTGARAMGLTAVPRRPAMGHCSADMESLFRLLRKRVDTNARRAVDTYRQELPEYRAVAENSPAQRGMLDFAVLLRRREAELGAEGEPFSETDLAVLTAYGADRGAKGVSLAAHRKVLVLHSNLTLLEIQEAAGPGEIDPMMRMLGWLPANGLAAQNAYTKGFLNGQKNFLPVIGRIRNLAGMLLTDDSLAGDIAESLGIRLASHYTVVVLRIAEEPLPPADRREEVIETLVKRFGVPVDWPEPDELVALIPGDFEASESSEERALSLVSEFRATTELACSPAAAAGRTGALAQAVALGRRVSRVAPVEAAPTHLNTLADVFVELGVSQMPQLDNWLRGFAVRLADGPDLVATLDAYYRNDMNRLNTAGALRIHPRTLDYRLHRVRELTGMDPGSLRGVRVLSATVARALAGAWS